MRRRLSCRIPLPSPKECQASCFRHGSDPAENSVLALPQVHPAYIPPFALSISSHLRHADSDAIARRFTSEEIFSDEYFLEPSRFTEKHIFPFLFSTSQLD